MKILVTGGLGYIGSHTVVELLNAHHDVVIIDNLSNAKAMVIDRIVTLTGKRPEWINLSVQDEQGLTSVFEQHTFDAVIHFAGFKAVGESVEKPLMYYENNVL